MSTPSTALPNYRRHVPYSYPHSHSHLYPISDETSAGTAIATSAIPQSLVSTATATYPCSIPALSSSLRAAPNAVTAAGGTLLSTSQGNELTSLAVSNSTPLATASAVHTEHTASASNRALPSISSTIAANGGGKQSPVYTSSSTTGHGGMMTTAYPYSHISSVPETSHPTQHLPYSASLDNYNQEQQSLASVPQRPAINDTAGSYYHPVTTTAYGALPYHLLPPVSSAASITASSAQDASAGNAGVYHSAQRGETTDVNGMAVGTRNSSGSQAHARHGQEQQQPTARPESPMLRPKSGRQTDTTHYQPQSQSTSASQSASSSQTPRRRRRKEGGPDWNEFYKNGPPREIIVIVDDDEIPPNSENANAGQTTTTYSTHIQPSSVSSHSSKRRRTGEESLLELGYYDHPTWASNAASRAEQHTPDYTLQTPVAVVDGPAGQQPAKKSTAISRAIANAAASSAHAIPAGRNNHVQQPVPQQPSNQQLTRPNRTALVPPVTASSAAGRSTTRTASSAVAPITPADFDAELPGQKRKRQTRKSVRDEQKRLEVEASQALQMAGGIMDYIPPAKPPYKAGEVKVPVVVDIAPKTKVDDSDGHYVVEEGADLAGKFKIVRLLGQGTFGKVVEAIDIHDRRKRHVAVKIIRSVQKYRDASKIELRVLQTLKQNDKTNRNRCIHLRDCFDYRSHICIVTDLLAMSVFDFLKNNGFTPFPSSHIQAFAKQLFTSVAYLHDLNLIHTDLKPENILLVDEDYQTFTYQRTIPSSTTTTNRRATQRKVLVKPEIRLIDFGSATFDDEYHSSVVSTRHYRAPEIILNLGWSFPCDIWSIGCILVEFFTGDALFQTHDNLEHLAMMEAVCGYKIDTRLARQTVQKIVNGQQNGAAKYFTKNRLDYPNSQTSRASKKFVKAMKRLDAFILPNNSFNKQFLDLLRRIFIYDPAKRITAKEALKHPWFNEQSLDDGSEAVRIGIQRRHYQLLKETEERAEAEARASARARPAHARVAAAPQ